MSPDFLNLPEAKPYAIAQTEKNTNRIGIRPFKSGDPTKAPFSAANGPVKKPITRRMIYTMAVIAAARSPLLSSLVSFSIFSSVLPSYFPKRGSTTFVQTKPITIEQRNVEAIMKNQLQVTSTWKVVSGKKPLIASFVSP